MSPYLRERAEEVFRVLTEDDRKVLADYMFEREHEIKARERRPPFFAIGCGLLAVGVLIWQTGSCLFDSEITAARSCCSECAAIKQAMRGVCDEAP